MMAVMAVIHDVGNGVGESPVWDDGPEGGVLRWVDIPGRAVYALGADGAITSHHVGDLACFLVLRRGGGAVVGLHRRLAYLDVETGSTTTFLAPEPERPTNRFNDAGVDPAGRLWFSTMQNNITEDGGGTPVTEATGALYRLDPDGSCHRVLDGIGLPNTLAWSPDGATMHFGDTMTNTIRRYVLDPDGNIRDAEDWHGTPPDGGCDGSALDEHGYLWNARFGAGCLIRFAPDGSVDTRVDLPVTNPTSCCFGGQDLRTLYVTSARFGLSEAALSANPQEGAVLALDVGVAGRAANRFAG